MHKAVIIQLEFPVWFLSEAFAPFKLHADVYLNGFLQFGGNKCRILIYLLTTALTFAGGGVGEPKRRFGMWGRYHRLRGSCCSFFRDASGTSLTSSVRVRSRANNAIGGSGLGRVGPLSARTLSTLTRVISRSATEVPVLKLRRWHYYRFLASALAHDPTNSRLPPGSR